MGKKIITSILIFLFLFLIPPIFYVLDHSQEISPAREKILYNLPYPGLLPDHHLYVLKAIRDKMMDLATRDNIKKADLYLLFSDKRAAMAVPLAKKGKDKLAISTISKGEKYFLKIPQLVTTSKKQGVSPPEGYVVNLKLSNAKHHEIIQTLIKNLPQGQNEALNEVLKINQEIKKEFDKI